MAPTVTNIAPSSGSLLSSDWQTARKTPITFDLTVDAGMLPVLRIKHGDNPHRWPVVYDGSKFSPLFAFDSTINSVGDVHTFSVIPRGGWWDKFEIVPGQVQEAVLLKTVAMDWTPPAYSSMDPAAVMKYRWGHQDASGPITEQLVGSAHNLVHAGGANLSYFDLVAVGVPSATGLTSRKCIEAHPGIAVGDRYESAGATLDPSQGSTVYRVAFRHPSSVLLSTDYRIAGHETAGGVGWALELLSNGRIRGRVYDGTTTVTLEASADDIADGSWHFAEIGIDWANGQIHVRTDVAAATPASISGVVQANTGGGAFAEYGTAAGACPGHLQIFDSTGGEGVNAETAVTETLADIWTHGADPQEGTIFERDSGSFPSYTGVAPAPAGNGLWALYSGDAGQFPVGWSQHLIDRGAPNGFGAACMQVAANKVTDSERLDISGTTSNLNVSAAVADLGVSATGFRHARRLEATADNGYYETAAIATTASQNHSIWATASGIGKTVTGRVIFWDAVGGAEIASNAFSVDDGVSKTIHLGGLSAPPNTSVTVRIEIDSSGDAIHLSSLVLHGPNIKFFPSDDGGLPIPTWGASASLPNIGGGSFFNAGDLVLAVKAQIDAFWLNMAGGTTGNSNQRIFDVRGAAMIVSAWARNGQTAQCQVWDDGSAGQGTISSAVHTGLGSKGLRFKFSWDSANEIEPGKHAVQKITDHIVTDEKVTAYAGGWSATDEPNLYQTFNELPRLIGYTEIHSEPEIV